VGCNTTAMRAFYHQHSVATTMQLHLGRAIPWLGVDGKEKLPVKSTLFRRWNVICCIHSGAVCQRCLDPLHRGGFIVWNGARSRTFKKEGMNNAKYKTYH
jgi:hypothetical protein